MMRMRRVLCTSVFSLLAACNAGSYAVPADAQRLSGRGRAPRRAARRRGIAVVNDADTSATAAWGAMFRKLWRAARPAGRGRVADLATGVVHLDRALGVPRRRPLVTDPDGWAAAVRADGAFMPRTPGSEGEGRERSALRRNTRPPAA